MNEFDQRKKKKKIFLEKKGSFSSSAENLCMFCNDDVDGCHSFISYDDDGSVWWPFGPFDDHHCSSVANDDHSSDDDDDRLTKHTSDSSCLFSFTFTF